MRGRIDLSSTTWVKKTVGERNVLLSDAGWDGERFDYFLKYVLRTTLENTLRVCCKISEL